MSDPYHIPGGELCTICGLTFYDRSMGGPGICPSCDCGNFGIQAIENQRKEIQRLAAEMAAHKETWELAKVQLDRLSPLELRIKALEAALRKIGYEPIGHAEATEREVLQAIVDIARSALETPADYTIDGDGVWMGGKWHPKGAPKSETFAKPKQFAPIGDGTICSNCTKTIGYHYQTAEGHLFCEVPKP